MIAALRGHSVILEKLVSIHGDVSNLDEEGFSALHVAVEYGQLNDCEEIMQMTPHKQQDTSHYLLAIFLALSAGNLEACQFFQDFLRGSDIEHLTANEWRKTLMLLSPVIRLQTAPTVRTLCISCGGCPVQCLSFQPRKRC